MSTSTQLGRGTLLGLIAGAFLGGALLLAASVYTHADCTGLSSTECAFEEQVHDETVRLEQMSAAGLWLLGAGAVIMLRTLKKDQKAS